MLVMAVFFERELKLAPSAFNDMNRRRLSAAAPFCDPPLALRVVVASDALETRLESFPVAPVMPTRGCAVVGSIQLSSSMSISSSSIKLPKYCFGKTSALCSCGAAR